MVHTSRTSFQMSQLLHTSSHVFRHDALAESAQPKARSTPPSSHLLPFSASVFSNFPVPRRFWVILRKLAILALALPSSFAAEQLDHATKQLSQDILKELIEINTTDSVGNVTTASEAMAKRL